MLDTLGFFSENFAENIFVVLAELIRCSFLLGYDFSLEFWVIKSKRLYVTLSRSLCFSFIFLIASLHSPLTFVSVSVYLSFTELNCDCNFVNSS